MNKETTFSLSAEDQEKLAQWKEMIEPDIRALVGNTNPRYGAAGGGYTYSFIPTGIGLIVKVTEYYTKKTLDLSDYESW